jgi:adenine-specific DNA methylase
MTYPKRLIEVDLPIKRISAHARREKSIRHGHISTLHIWWARRPLAACRAVICAALWPDPADPLCPQDFRDKAAEIITNFARDAVEDKTLAQSCSPDTWNKWRFLASDANRIIPKVESHQNILRNALLDFIADFANWDNSTNEAYLNTSRALTESAHIALGGEPGTRPLVVDPFAGGGAIPLEALRVGADAFASDLNPVAVLLNKVVLEYIPKYGQRLADEVRKWGEWIKREAEKELAEFYPKDPDGATPIAYLWARTIVCEGPGCGAEVPLMRSLWLSKKAHRSTALRIVPNPKAKRVDFEIIEKKGKEWTAQSNPQITIRNPQFEGTVKRGSATCLFCGYTTPVTSVRRQLKARRGGTADAHLFCVVTTRANEQGRFYRLPTNRDVEIVRKAAAELERKKKTHSDNLSLVPEEQISLNEIRRVSVPIYGMMRWGDLYTPRQLLALTTLAKFVRKMESSLTEEQEKGAAEAIQTCLAITVNRQADKISSLGRWDTSRENAQGTFARQVLPLVWDFSEVNPLSGAGGDWDTALNWVQLVILQNADQSTPQGNVEQASAASHPLPDDSAEAFISDPPYYDAVPYAYLSDFFYVWLKRMLGEIHPGLFSGEAVPKQEEIVVDRPHELSTSKKDIAFYEQTLKKAFGEGRRVLAPSGIGVIIFASKTTASWEAILQAMVDSGWVISGSWPIDTEMENRVAAQGQARLGSSVHIICRPRENLSGSLRIDYVGDWRDVLQELPQCIHEWMPRLAAEGVVGADAIFACLGPAIEIFSIQRLSQPGGILVVKGNVARLNGVAERERYLLGQQISLFGSEATKVVKYRREKPPIAKLKNVEQRHEDLFGVIPPAKRNRDQPYFPGFGLQEDGRSKLQLMMDNGSSLLDRLHQAMLLFARSYTALLRPFLVETQMATNPRFWQLAQALAALYPQGSDERRWVEGVLARKKGLGF